MKIQAESSALFEFGQFARLLLLGRGSLSDIEGLIERNTPDRVIRLVKSAQAFASTTDPDFAALSDYNAISTSFLDTLVPWGAFDGMLSSMRRVPLRTPIAISSAAIIG